MKKPLHLGHVLRHPNFRRNMNRCVKRVVEQGHESMFLVYNTVDRGMLFTKVEEGECSKASKEDLYQDIDFEVLGSKQESRTFQRILRSEIYLRIGQKEGGDLKEGEGCIIHLHTHPSNDPFPIFSAGDMQIFAAQLQHGCLTGLSPVYSVGGVFEGSYGKRHLSLLVFQGRNAVEVHSAWEDFLEREENFSHLFLSREEIVESLPGRAMYLDFSFGKSWNIIITDEIVQKASQMVIFQG